MLTSARNSRFLRLRWIALLFIAFGIFIAWNKRAPILRKAAVQWVISDPVERADAIVVLSGRIDVRPFAAAEIYKQGFASRILISNVLRSYVETMQLGPSQTELTRKVLLKLGIPAEAIIEVGDAVSSTYDESRAVLDWAKRNGAKTVIVPTEIFGTRRVHWIFEHECAPAGIRVLVHAIPLRSYGPDNWWQDERGLMDFQNEVMKYVYYRFSY